MTRGSNIRPTRRVMVSAQYGDEYVVEIGLEFLNVRPKRSRRGGSAEHSITPGKLYLWLVDAARRAEGHKRLARKIRRAR